MGHWAEDTIGNWQAARCMGRSCRQYIHTRSPRSYIQGKSSERERESGVHKRALVRQLVSITRPLLSIDRDGNSTSLTRSHSSLSVRIACCIIMCMRHRSAILSTQTHTLIKRPAPTQQFFCNATPASSARKKNKSQSSSAFIAPRSCIFFAPGRWSVAASAASTDQTAAGII
jgi:hypothetical protein